MEKRLTANEMAELFCDDFSNSESEEEGGEEVYGYRSKAVIDPEELHSLSRTVSSTAFDDGSKDGDLNMATAQDSEDNDSSGCEEMEVDVPGKIK